MKQLFDTTAYKCSREVTKGYSTSFSLAVKMLSPKIRMAIHSIYAFVRFADEIVDSFHDFKKEELLEKFKNEYYVAYEQGISLNPILNSFQQTVKKYDIDDSLIQSFLLSMKADLGKLTYNSQEEYEQYIYGSADVVGLMCLKVFVNGDSKKYNELKYSAMKLGSAFQKVNFLRDLKDDIEVLNRSYFPNVNFNQLTKKNKEDIISDIEQDFDEAFKGIKRLPIEAKFGVYTAYVYYKRLLNKLKRTPSKDILNVRVRVSNPMKIGLLARSFVAFKLNLL
ncbi:Phytoene/squalene synthetase [Lutibacter oricola]|uniref:Phytoene/squalene synthetase n=1 Tax=Lutibacter oricola TaxID=762486 RepID=A0A1H3A849_9FLAO|nr:phytoene/squalene synthase family protein [Lutibacter oricola]SDX25621.1 Phytoene/squalene synthetase [Lutibacter oricola]